MSWIYLYILVVFYSCLVYVLSCTAPVLPTVQYIYWYVRESERPPVVSPCCLRGSQRLPPWNRRRRGTELGSDRPAKTPLQKIWGGKQGGASTEDTCIVRSKYYTDPKGEMAGLFHRYNNDLNPSHPMLLKRCFLLIVGIILWWPQGKHNAI